MPFDRDRMKDGAAQLAAQGIFVGTSSWKYAGWCGTLYNSELYQYRGKFAASRFEKGCLAEYSQVFKTVCVDSAYYAFPTRQQLEGLAAQVSPDFLFAFKVTDEITVKRFPNLPRFAARAGKTNENFLNAALFAESFLAPCESIRSHVGALVFEFSKFHTEDYSHGREFVDTLENFLAALPSGWPYGVELRNRSWLQPEYFGCLARHKVAHVFNSWNAMPPISEQLVLPGSQTNPNLCVARFLLKPGRKYEDAVKVFEPYDKVKEVVPEARQAGRALISEGLQKPSRKTFIYVNNRLEGNALETLDAMMF